MNDFIRARSENQKDSRRNEIKTVTAELFENVPYHEITLTLIAQKLGWSRANLYKYATTKEEIILDIANDKMQSYFDSLLAAFPEGNHFSPEIIAEIWAGILNAHKDYLRYVAYLNPVIETNVTVERLAAFKKKYYDKAYAFRNRLAEMLGIRADIAYKLLLDILLYTSSIACCCYANPLILQALQKIGIEAPETDFNADMKELVLMKVEWVRGR